jgi:AtzE family amidohydrolase
VTDPLTSDACAVDIAAAVRAGRVSAGAVINAALARVAKHNPTVNAFVATCETRARQDAAAIERAIASGHAVGPLAGVPFGVKAMMDVAGLTTTAGSRLHVDDPPARADAPVIAQLRAAGAICLGALNMDELGLGGTTENALFGATRNPHALNCTAGGSSGGSAAAVASGMVPFTLGADGLGSIRLPASLCGVYGLRVTRGSLSHDGTVGSSGTISTIGPLARTAADLGLVLRALGVVVGDATQSDVGDLRIAVAGGYFARQLTAEAATAVMAVAQALNATRTIEYPDASRAKAAATLVFAAESGAAQLPALREHLDQFDPKTRERFLAHALIPAAWYLRAQAFRKRHRQAVLALLKDVDVLLCPATPGVAPALGTNTLCLDGIDQPIGPALGYFTQPLAPIDCPVLTVPVARPNAMPIGVQLLAAPHGEARLLRVARFLEDCNVVAAPVASDYAAS